MKTVSRMYVHCTVYIMHPCSYIHINKDQNAFVVSYSMLLVPPVSVIYEEYLRILNHVYKGAKKHLCTPTTKTQYRKFETNIPRKGIELPQSQFPHSCICERFTLYIPSLPILLQENMWTDPENI
jgi:hypothetical protein